MYVANVNEDGFENNPHLDAVRARAATEGAEVVPVSAAIEEELSQLDDADRDAFLTRPGSRRARPEPGDPCRLQAARPADLFHRRGEGSARLDGQGRFHRAAGRGRDPHRFRKGLHPRRDHRLRRFPQVQGRSRCQAMPAACAWKARSTACRKATSCTSASTSERIFDILMSMTVDRRPRALQNCWLFGKPCGSPSRTSGGIPKRPTGADCKSAGLRLRWFESTSLHQFHRSIGFAVPGGLTSHRRNTGRPPGAGVVQW